MTARLSCRLRQQPRESLSDADVLSALLGSEPDAPDLAQEALASYGDIPGLARVDFSSLENRFGLRKAMVLLSAFEAGRRALLRTEPWQPMSCAEDVYRYFAPRIAHLHHEVFHVLCLSARHHLLQDVRITEGGFASCSVKPREAFAPALRASAVAVIFVHNHPSGVPSPSAEDLALTARLRDAGKVLDIDALDHLIIGRGTYVSLQAQGHFSK